jgi:hypothetical protein
MSQRMDKESEKREDNLCDEMQEREVRRMNLIIHSVEEQPDTIRGNQKRAEKTKIDVKRFSKQGRPEQRKTT